MAKISPEQFEKRVTLWLNDLSAKFEQFAPAIFARWRGRAVGRYMRDAKGEGRRDPGDTGPLRILSGDLAGAIGAGGPNRPGVVERVKGEPLRVTFEKGVDLDAVVYARIHEKGGRAGRNHASVIPARPYIRPALVDEKAAIARIARRGLRDSFAREVLSQ